MTTKKTPTKKTATEAKKAFKVPNKPTAPPKIPAKKVVMYASKKLYMYHPHQDIRFFPGTPVKCEMDVWLKGQIDAGLIKEV